MIIVVKKEQKGKKQNSPHFPCGWRSFSCGRTMQARDEKLISDTKEKYEKLEEKWAEHAVICGGE